MESPSADILKQSSVKNLSHSLIAYFLMSYGLIPFNLLATFLFYHYLLPLNYSPDANSLLFALMFIGSDQIILIFLPPALSTAMYYKIAEYASHQEYGKIKGAVSYGLRIKGMLGAIATGVYLLLGWIWYQSPNPQTSMNGWAVLIVSPMGYLNELLAIYLTVISSLRHFGIESAIQFIGKACSIVGYLGIFMAFPATYIETHQVQILTDLLLLVLITSLAQLGVQYRWYWKHFHRVTLIPVTREEMKAYTKFGAYYAISGSCSTVYGQVVNFQLNGIYNGQMYYNLSKNMMTQAQTVSNLPIGSVFTDLEQHQHRAAMVQLWLRSTCLYSIIVNCIVHKNR
jgi:hypothetical protein